MKEFYRETGDRTRGEAMREIERAAKNNLTELNLSMLDLEELPPEISECTQLEKLVVAAYQPNKFEAKRRYGIAKFPDAVLKLTNLKILMLSNHGITEIPEEIGQLSNLTKLHLGKNK
ncbi:hypothetical protein [Microcoleus sp. Pol12B4]|uniref:hypothetical protein n=1 Tax=Microcoleus sp. Pol12B4 TaxID=3055395 RepID=UPI002FD234D2